MLTLPATLTLRNCKPLCTCNCAALNAWRAAGFKNTASGENSENRFESDAGTGINAGTMLATDSTSTPNTRSACRSG